MKNPNNSKTKQICYPGFTQALLMQHAFGTGLEHERNSRFDQLSQRMCPWSFFGHQTWSFFFSKGISNFSFPPPPTTPPKKKCSTKEILGTPKNAPQSDSGGSFSKFSAKVVEWSFIKMNELKDLWWKLEMIRSIYSQKVVQLRITHIIGGCLFSAVFLLFFRRDRFYGKKRLNHYEILWGMTWMWSFSKARTVTSSGWMCVEFAYIAHQPEVFWVLQCLDIDGHPGFLFSPAVNMARWDRKESLHSDLANLKAQSLRSDENVQRLGWRWWLVFRWHFGRNVTLRYRHDPLFLQLCALEVLEVCRIMRYQHIVAILSTKCHRSCNVHKDHPNP